MKFTIFNIDTGVELVTFATKEEAMQYCTNNKLEAVRIEAGGETAFVRPPFQDDTDLVIYVLPENFKRN